MRAFAGRTLLSNLHESAWLRPERFTRALTGRAAQVIGELVATLDEWRSSATATNARGGP